MSGEGATNDQPPRRRPPLNLSWLVEQMAMVVNAPAPSRSLAARSVNRRAVVAYVDRLKHTAEMPNAEA